MYEIGHVEEGGHDLQSHYNIKHLNSKYQVMLVLIIIFYLLNAPVH